MGVGTWGASGTSTPRGTRQALWCGGWALICLRGGGVSHKGRGLGNGRGGWATWAVRQESGPSQVCCCTHPETALSGRWAPSTAAPGSVCQLRLAEPHVALGHLRSCCGDSLVPGPLLSLGPGPSFPWKPDSVGLWMCCWAADMVSPPPRRMCSPPWQGAPSRLGGLCLFCLLRPGCWVVGLGLAS